MFQRTWWSVLSYVHAVVMRSSVTAWCMVRPKIRLFVRYACAMPWNAPVIDRTYRSFRVDRTQVRGVLQHNTTVLRICVLQIIARLSNGKRGNPIIVIAEYRHDCVMYIMIIVEQNRAHAPPVCVYFNIQCVMSRYRFEKTKKPIFI